MRVLGFCLGLTATLLLLSPQSALARELSVATVTPQGVACVFTPTCAVSVTDTIGYFKLFGDGGNGKLLVRTYPGVAGTQAAGLTGYSLYIDMRGTTALGMANCVEQLTLDVGPVVALKYVGGSMADLFVVGAPSGIGLSSVSQSGSRIAFHFARPICPGPKGESLYFGFAAKNGPVPSKGQVTGSLEGAADVDVRVPKH
jgi:hypothetical protein